MHTQIFETIFMHDFKTLEITRLRTAINPSNVGVKKNSQRFHLEGRLMPPIKDVYILFSKNCEYEILHGKETL